MRENIEVTKVSGYKYRAHNKDYAMGNYFSEDDWDITVYAETIEDLKIKAVDKIFESGIYIDSEQLSKSEWIEHNGLIFELSEEPINSSSVKFDYINTDYYKQERKKHDDRLKREKEEEIQKEKDKTEQREKEEFIRLKNKFGS